METLRFTSKTRQLFRDADGTITECSVLTPIPKDSDQTNYVLRRRLCCPAQSPMGNVIYYAFPAIADPTGDGLVAAGPVVVIKALRKVVGSSKAPDPFRELAITRVVTEKKIPHCIHLLDCMQDFDCVYLVLRYLEGGELFTVVADTMGKGLSDEQAKNYLKPVLESLVAMKQVCGVVHHDVSLENIMLDATGAVYLIDLGLSSQLQHGQTPSRPKVYVHSGKPSYIAPELTRRGKEYDLYAADVWSMGVALYACLTGHQLYQTPRDDSFKALAEGRIRSMMAWDEWRTRRRLSQHAKALICRMLHPDYKARPTLEQVLEDPFFTSSSSSSSSGSSPAPEKHNSIASGFMEPFLRIGELVRLIFSS